MARTRETGAADSRVDPRSAGREDRFEHEHDDEAVEQVRELADEGRANAKRVLAYVDGDESYPPRGNRWAYVLEQCDIIARSTSNIYVCDVRYDREAGEWRYREYHALRHRRGGEPLDEGTLDRNVAHDVIQGAALLRPDRWGDDLQQIYVDLFGARRWVNGE
jgi:hypothetical protein